MCLEASRDLRAMLSQLLPHFFRRRGRRVSYAAERDGDQGIEVFHSIKMMLRKPHKVVAERG